MLQLPLLLLVVVTASYYRYYCCHYLLLLLVTARARVTRRKGKEGDRLQTEAPSMTRHEAR